MKLLVIGIDALSPQFVFEELDEYPNMKKLIQDGKAGQYDGYVYGYGSRDNWISLYTGLKPAEHQVINGVYQPTGKMPRLYDYSNKKPFWEILNEKGYEIGLWKALSSSPPAPIDGYMVSGEPAFDDFYEDLEIVSDGPMLCHKDSYLLSSFKGEYPKFPIPKSPEYFGYTWDEIHENPLLLKKILTEDYFIEGLEFLEKVLDYSLENIKNVNERKAVDLFWFYDSIFDYVGHFQMHDKNNKIMKKAIKKVDNFIGTLIKILKPENVIVLSDHGQQSIIDFFPSSDTKLQKEAFGLADQCVFLDDTVIMKARNGGFLSALHSLKATIIMSGKDFKQGTIRNMRNIDFYPTLLELFNCKVPDNRTGFVQPVFNKQKLLNEDKQFPESTEKKKVLLIQTCEVSQFNRFINEFYLDNRFCDIYIRGEKKYEDIFLANPQVTGFFDNRVKIDKGKFYKTLVPYFNNKTKESYLHEI